MVTKLKIKKGDTVQVITGQDKGKKGTVLEINTTGPKVKVQGVKMMTHFDKKDGLKTLEGFIDYSNIKLIEKSGSKAKKSSGKKAGKTA